MNFKEQVEKINKIEQNEKGLFLIKAMEDMFVVDKIVVQILNRPKYKRLRITNKIGQDIIDEFRVKNHYTFFEKEFKQLCGFEVDDELAGDIIFQCFTEKKVNLQKLKDTLIELL